MQEIRLKGTAADDYDDYYKIRCSPGDIYWNGYTGAPQKEGFRELFLNRLSTARFEQPEDRRLYLIELADATGERPVGFVQLIRREDGVDIGYTVVEEYQGRGYATKALALGVELARAFGERIYVQIRDDNRASQAVARKCGFRATDEYTVHDYPGCGEVKLRKHVLA